MFLPISVLLKSSMCLEKRITNSTSVFFITLSYEWDLLIFLNCELQTQFTV